MTLCAAAKAIGVNGEVCVSAVAFVHEEDCNSHEVSWYVESGGESQSFINFVSDS